MKRSVVLFLALTFFTISNIFSQQVCLNNAWKALGEEDYKSAILHCDECIETEYNSKKKFLPFIIQ
jgi:hypothetical protein